MLLNDPVIVAPLRTPIGKFQGAFSHNRADDLITHILKEVVYKAKIDGALLDEVIVGCANQAGEDNRNVARMAVLLSDFGTHIPAITLNRLCASGLDAIIAGARMIMTNEASIVFTGGVENMTRAPLVMSKAGKAFSLGVPEIFDTALGWRFFNEKMKEVTPPEPNGMTAENLASMFDITRSQQDDFALLSHQNAVAAQMHGFFKDEISPIFIGDKEKILFKNDEGPRAQTSLEKLSSLKPAFKKDGSVTAGNSSSLNDGAAGMLVCSSIKAKELGAKPLARILGFANAGVDPREMGIGPVFSTQKLLKNLNMSIDDFDAIEINEAFAAQVIAVIKELKINPQKVNPYGGAIALGHPLGCSGSRIVCTLLNYLTKNKKTLGLATLCVGVGQGVSIAVEML